MEEAMNKLIVACCEARLNYLFLRMYASVLEIDRGLSAHSALRRSGRNGLRQLDEFEKKQDEDDREDEADSAAAIVAEPWSHAIPAKAEHQNQNDQKDRHL
jgi:hypothetical protein